MFHDFTSTFNDLFREIMSWATAQYVEICVMQDYTKTKIIAVITVNSAVNIYKLQMHLSIDWVSVHRVNYKDQWIVLEISALLFLLCMRSWDLSWRLKMSLSKTCWCHQRCITKCIINYHNYWLWSFLAGVCRRQTTWNSRCLHCPLINLLCIHMCCVPYELRKSQGVFVCPFMTFRSLSRKFKSLWRSKKQAINRPCRVIMLWKHNELEVEMRKGKQ